MNYSTILTKVLPNGDIVKSHVTVELDKESDGSIYRVLETGFTSTSLKTAINNAIAFIRKKIKKYNKSLEKSKKKGKIRKAFIPIETDSTEILRPNGRVKIERIRTKNVKRVRTKPFPKAKVKPLPKNVVRRFRSANIVKTEIDLGFYNVKEDEKVLIKKILRKKRKKK